MTGAEAYRNFLLTSSAWAAKRKLVLRRDHYVCTICQASDTPLHVHHLAYTARWGEEPLSDLIAICSADHAMLHARTVPSSASIPAR
jgi:5-methylcytosine-specific restriction endonuclease McrA